MKIMSRDFTTAEKVLILLLSLVLLGLAYYWFVDQPVRNGIQAAESERDALETELVAVEAKVMRLQRMQDELERLGSMENVSRMESYNNSKAELSELNSILEAADTYTISFAGVTREGDQIRRNFTLQFTTGSDASAKRIMSQLSQSRYRCLIGDVRYAKITRDRVLYGTGRDWDGVSVSTAATFFETMYDGTPDAGLPQ